MKPKIGIVVCGLNDNKQYVSESYINATKHAGGLPVIIPAVKSNEAIHVYSELCDGFLFCGGADITPLLFGEEPKYGLGETDITLDIFQLRLMRQVLSTGKPVFAICRGIQILNVACGGTVYQDITLQPGNPINHMQTSLQRRDVCHKVIVTPRSKLQKIIGNFVYTNSYHHQTLGKLGNNLAICGRTADGTIEAIELLSDSFVLGVQWHPECMLQSSQQMKDLFVHFTRRCLLTQTDI